MKFSDYFERRRQHRRDRSDITLGMCQRVVAEPLEQQDQKKGRKAYWAYIAEKERYLRVILEEDRETVFNAFWDRNFGRRIERERKDTEDED